VVRAGTQLHQFVRDHESQLTTGAHDHFTTTEHLDRMTRLQSSGSSRMAVYIEIAETFLRRVGCVLFQAEALSVERTRCMRLCGRTTDDGMSALYIVQDVVTSS